METVNCTEESFDVRDYQMQMLRMSQAKNSIIFLPPGSGKTYIAIMLIKSLTEDLEKSIKDGGKRSILVTNTNSLANQHADNLRILTCFNIGKYTGGTSLDEWDKNKWIEELDNMQILVLTSQVFLNLMEHYAINMCQMNVIVFDECHNAVGDHPMRRVMGFYDDEHPELMPRIIGLTATLLNATETKEENILNTLTELEKTLRSTIITVDEPSEVKLYTANPIEIPIRFQKTTNDFLRCKDLRIEDLINVKKYAHGIGTDPETEELILMNNARDINIRILSLFYDALYNAEELGIAGGNICASLHLERLGKYEFNHSNVEEKRVTDILISCFHVLRNLLKVKMEDIGIDDIGKNEIWRVSSDAVNKLLDILKKLNWDDKCIIFVKRRSTAKTLLQIIKAANLENVSAEYIIGFHYRPLTTKNEISKNDQYTILNTFNRTNSINVIISTSVIEEGIDIKKCNYVIKFDPELSYCSYVQSKGRARDKQSQFYLFIPEGSEKDLKTYEQYKIIEQELPKYITRKSFGSTIPQGMICTRKSTSTDVYFSPNGKCKATLQSSLDIVTRYCITLPHDTNSSYLPYLWKKVEDNGMVTCLLQFPLTSRVKELVKGVPCSNWKSAKRHAHLEAVKLLHEIGEIDDEFKSKKYEILTHQLYQFCPNWVEDDNDSSKHKAGTRKRTRTEPLTRVLENFPPINPMDQVYLHVIVTKPSLCTESLPAKVDTKCYLSPMTFGFITTTPLPKISEFPLFVTAGTIHIQIIENLRAYSCFSIKNLQRIKKFHFWIFKELLQLVKPFLSYNFKNCPIFVVPVIMNENESIKIDWDIMDKVHVVPNYEPSITKRRRNRTLWNKHYYDQTIVTPWYRLPGYFMVLKVCTDMSPLSVFKSNDSTTITFADYFLEKYGIELCHHTQPMLLVRNIKKNYNFTKPRSVGKKRLSQHGSNMMYLVPELCVEQVFNSVYWLKATMIPAIMHRIEQILLSDQLMRKIASVPSIHISENYNRAEKDFSKNGLYIQKKPLTNLNAQEESEDQVKPDGYSSSDDDECNSDAEIESSSQYNLGGQMDIFVPPADAALYVGQESQCSLGHSDGYVPPVVTTSCVSQNSLYNLGHASQFVPLVDTTPHVGQNLGYNVGGDMNRFVPPVDRTPRVSQNSLYNLGHASQFVPLVDTTPHVGQNLGYNVGGDMNRFVPPVDRTPRVSQNSLYNLGHASQFVPLVDTTPHVGQNLGYNVGGDMNRFVPPVDRTPRVSQNSLYNLGHASQFVPLVDTTPHVGQNLGYNVGGDMNRFVPPVDRTPRVSQNSLYNLGHASQFVPLVDTTPHVGQNLGYNVGGDMNRFVPPVDRTPRVSQNSLYNLGHASQFVPLVDTTPHVGQNLGYNVGGDMNRFVPPVDRTPRVSQNSLYNLGHASQFVPLVDTTPHVGQNLGYNVGGDMNRFVPPVDRTPRVSQNSLYNLGHASQFVPLVDTTPHVGQNLGYNVGGDMNRFVPPVDRTPRVSQNSLYNLGHASQFVPLVDTTPHVGQNLGYNVGGDMNRFVPPVDRTPRVSQNSLYNLGHASQFVPLVDTTPHVGQNLGYNVGGDMNRFVPPVDRTPRVSQNSLYNLGHASQFVPLVDTTPHVGQNLGYNVGGDMNRFVPPVDRTPRVSQNSLYNLGHASQFVPLVDTTPHVGQNLGYNVGGDMNRFVPPVDRTPRVSQNSLYNLGHASQFVPLVDTTPHVGQNLGYNVGGDMNRFVPPVDRTPRVSQNSLYNLGHASQFVPLVDTTPHVGQNLRYNVGGDMNRHLPSVADDLKNDSGYFVRPDSDHSSVNSSSLEVDDKMDYSPDACAIPGDVSTDVPHLMIFMNRNIPYDGLKHFHIVQALTSKCTNDFVNMDRLETLGDSYLKYAVSLSLFSTCNNLNEGNLSDIKSKIIGNRNLYYIASKLGLKSFIKVDEFSPYAYWKPPGFQVHETLKSILHRFPWLLNNIKLKGSEQEFDYVTPETTQKAVRAMERYNNKTPQGKFESRNNRECYGMLSYFDMQTVCDKILSDTVEALVGVYLEKCGMDCCFQLIQYFEILGKGTTENINEILKHPPNPIIDNNIFKTHQHLIPHYKLLENAIGYEFVDVSYLLVALTHASYMSHGLTECYQKLEFLGDAVIDFLVTAYIYEYCGILSPGQLTDLRSALVNNVTFACISVKIGLQKHLLIGSTKMMSSILKFVERQERNNHQIGEEILYSMVDQETDCYEYADVPKVMADLFESLMGAIFLDSGRNLRTVWNVLYKLMRNELDQFCENVPKNPVRAMHELFPNTEIGKAEVLPSGKVKVAIVVKDRSGKKRTLYGYGDNKNNAKRAVCKLAVNFHSQEYKDSQGQKERDEGRSASRKRDFKWKEAVNTTPADRTRRTIWQKTFGLINKE